MHLTNVQLTTLKNWVEANAAGVYEESTLALLNAAASPNYWIWRTRVSRQEIVSKPSPNGSPSPTNFTWAGNGFITRSVQEQGCWAQLFDAEGYCCPALANVRQAFTDIFSGTGNAAANRTHLANTGRRQATVFEKLFATTPGDGTTGTPATPQVDKDGVFIEGPLDLAHLIEAANV
jgi:hypothetical protein